MRPWTILLAFLVGSGLGQQERPPSARNGKFRIGSLTKQFTATAILLLEDRGKLRIEDPIRKYVPDAPVAWGKVTSFPDYAAKSLSPMSAQQLIAWFKEKPLDFEAGTKFSYSNSDDVLLGYLIEKLSGKTYEKFLQENVFTPFGMKDCGYDSNTALIERRASG